MSAELQRALLTVEAAGRPPRQYVMRPGQRFLIGRGFADGRPDPDGAAVGIALEDPQVSRQHASLELGPGGLTLTDLGSTNGTLLGGRRLPARTRTPLASGAAVDLGKHRLTVQLQEETSGAPSLTELQLLRLLDLPDDEYRLRGRVATGSKSFIWAARHLPSRKDLAVKVLRQSLMDPAACERFVRKARLAQQLKTPCVVRISDVRQAIDGRPFLVMELVHGQSAQDRVEAEGPLPAPSALWIAADLAGALAAAAQVDIVHRDVSPHNVLFSPSGIAKLGGFGMARMIGADVTSLRETGEVEAGSSLPFMAPEQFEEQADHRTDLYGLGATLYFLLCGRPPFLARGPAFLPELWREIAEDEPPSLGDFQPGLAAELVELVHELLRKDPARRPQTAVEVLERLLTLSDAGPGPRTPGAGGSAGPETLVV